MKLQRLLSLTRQAVDAYQMIRTGDVIAVGLSGGKDSMTLLYALKELQRFYPQSFQLQAITVDLGHEGFDRQTIEEYCRRLEVPLTIVSTRIGPILFEERKESNPCSLCAKMRKGALNEKALELGCNKIAYAHHRDDVIETLFLSLFYEGQMQTLEPFFHLDRTGLTVIRPLIYVTEAEVKGFRNKYEIPTVTNPCPADGNTRRAYVKELIRQLSHENPQVRGHIFHAIENEHEIWKLRKREAFEDESE